MPGMLKSRGLSRVFSNINPGGLPNPGIELGSPALQEDSLSSEVKLVYNVVLILVVLQSDSIMYISFRFFSILGCHEILNTVASFIE